MTRTKLDGIKPLDFTSRAYMDAHLNFRARLTNQGELMREWLTDWLKARIADNGLDRLRLASIGCGAGIIDAPLINSIQKDAPVSFLGIEPNKLELEKAREAISDILAPASEAHFFEGLAEDAPEIEGRFDAVIGVHVWYYSTEILPLIRQAKAMLAPGGQVAALVSAPSPQTKLFVETTEALAGYRPPLSDDFRALLDAEGIAHSHELLTARIDVTEFAANPRSDESMLFLDFFLHADSRSISEDTLSEYIAAIIDNAARDGDRLILPHPVEAVTFPA